MDWNNFMDAALNST